MESSQYIELKKQVGDALQSQAMQFDKAILTLAAGALALSLTFIKDIAPTPDPLTVRLLAASWTCFIGSLVSTLFSHRLSILAFQRYDEILNTLHAQPGRDPKTLQNGWKKGTEILNYTSLIALILGAVFLSFCAYHGLGIKEHNMSTDKASAGPATPGPAEHRGAIPLSPPASAPGRECGAVPTSPPNHGPSTPPPAPPPTKK